MLKKMRDEGEPEQKLIDAGLFMTCKLSGRDGKGTDVDLVPNGSTVPVSYSNLDSYCKLLVKERLAEADQQIGWIKEGMGKLLEERMTILRIFSW